MKEIARNIMRVLVIVCVETDKDIPDVHIGNRESMVSIDNNRLHISPKAIRKYMIAQGLVARHRGNDEVRTENFNKLGKFTAELVVSLMTSSASQDLLQQIPQKLIYELGVSMAYEL